MNFRQAQGLGLFRRGFAAQAFAALLLLAIAGRTESDFFHTHEALCDNGPTIAAPCSACDVEATVTLNAPPPPVIPPLGAVSIEVISTNLAKPFAPAILHTQGRAPPAL